MSDGQQDERLRQTIVALRYMKADADSIPHYIQSIGLYVERLDYDYGTPEQLHGLDNLREKLHEVEQALLQLHLDMRSRYG